MNENENVKSCQGQIQLNDQTSESGIIMIFKRQKILMLHLYCETNRKT